VKDSPAGGSGRGPAGRCDGAPILTAQEPAFARAPDRVALVGFMGAGKTTVGRELAGQLGWAFLDVDDIVVQAAGRSIADIFAREGEARFRQMELAALRQGLKDTRTVLALGGGAVELPEIRQALAASPRTLTIYLQAPLDTLCARCEEAAQQPGTARRPVFEDRPALSERYARRLPFYRAAAHWTIDASYPAHQVARTILEFWSTTFERSR
jgi:shikimate kinase